MSEEEKEAIEEIKKALRLAENIDNITTTIRNEYAEIIVELIKKQQKEIEVLREENFDTVYIKAVADFKDKIREKIKNLEENIDNLYNSSSLETAYCQAELDHLREKKDILKELLEE